MCKIVTVFIIGLIMAAHSMVYAQEWQYEVKPGDSLWSIAESYMISELYYLDLQALNKVKYPRRMQPGRIIRAPVEWLGNFPGSARIVTVVGEVEIVRQNQTSQVEQNNAHAQYRISGKGAGHNRTRNTGISIRCQFCLSGDVGSP